MMSMPFESNTTDATKIKNMTPAKQRRDKGSNTVKRARRNKKDGKISDTQGEDFLSPTRLCRVGDQ
jgi:hypothetical protein